jgi:hypothetical protein
MLSARSASRSPRNPAMSCITCSPMPSIWCVLASTSCVKRCESSPIDCEISFTSCAMTANPDPASPACALSIRALIASMRVREMKVATSRACAEAVAESSKASGTMRWGIGGRIPWPAACGKGAEVYTGTHVLPGLRHIVQTARGAYAPVVAGQLRRGMRWAGRSPVQDLPDRPPIDLLAAVRWRQVGLQLLHQCERFADAHRLEDVDRRTQGD